MNGETDDTAGMRGTAGMHETAGTGVDGERDGLGGGRDRHGGSRTHRGRTTVGIGEAAVLAGTTPTAIRHHHRAGVLPEPERGPDGRRRYGYDDLVRILWAVRMTELGLPQADVRSALDPGTGGEGLLAGLDAAFRARRPTVAGPRPHPLGREVAAYEAAGRHVEAAHPRLRAERTRLEAELEALAEAAAEDVRVERLAHDWFVHIQALEAAARATGFPEPDFTDAEPDLARTERIPVGGPPPREPSPAQSRCAQLLGVLLDDWCPPEPKPDPYG
ncbi:MerR family transcriptional regulator [Streptomyces sp. NPDC089799]|uniref:MerR family transcriptional regulator n=1 Tax=Streptomyces sp. NPDC089799 TaxID=3155066 RepID=UPI003430961E